MSRGLDGTRIVLGVSGGIAAYKAVEVLRLLKKAGAHVRVIMTGNATEFVGPVTFEALSNNRVCTGLFKDTEKDASIRHIEWAQEADLVVVAPATANIIGKYANGLADDALSTLLLAATAPVIVCPAMNTHMYEHPAVQRNIEQLRRDGRTIVEPGSGELACGTVGPGRLADPDLIFDRICYLLAEKDFQGLRVLITAGPTREAVDPVRFLSNPSSGKMGYEIARAAEYRGAAVTLVSGPVSISAPGGVRRVPVTTAQEMADAVFAEADAADVIIKTAAVADFRPKDPAAHKIKKEDPGEERTLVLERTVDILKTLGGRKKDRFLVGFAAETRDLERYAKEKLSAKNLDMIAANIVGGADAGFGADTNRISLFFRDGGKEELPLMEKSEAAHLLLDRIRARLNPIKDGKA